MARVKNTRRKVHPPPVMTWTRFHLPREQHLPTWSVEQTPGHVDVHHGPLKGVPGCERAWLGRMVEDPKQAAYIIEWATPDDVKNFQSSPACAEFLQNLPELDDSVNLSLGLRKMTLIEESSSSSTVSRRFLLLNRLSIMRIEVEDRVTFTAFLIPGKIDNVFRLWRKHFEWGFSSFMPRGYETLTFGGPMGYRTRNMCSATWFHVLSEDAWVEKNFGKLEEQTGEGGKGYRTIFCQFYLWPSRWGGTPEKEAASVADAEGRELWIRAIQKLMPPATAWVQERWDIHRVPGCGPPPVEAPLEEPEFEREIQEFFEQYRRPEESDETAPSTEIDDSSFREAR